MTSWMPPSPANATGRTLILTAYLSRPIYVACTDGNVSPDGSGAAGALASSPADPVPARGNSDASVPPLSWILRNSRCCLTFSHRCGKYRISYFILRGCDDNVPAENASRQSSLNDHGNAVMSRLSLAAADPVPAPNNPDAFVAPLSLTFAVTVVARLSTLFESKFLSVQMWEISHISLYIARSRRRMRPANRRRPITATR